MNYQRFSTLIVTLAFSVLSAFAHAEVTLEQNPPYIELDQAALDRTLAPIALYPDSLLSHILVASSYPLEVVQADRWRQDRQSLSAEEALEQAADQGWDPSVAALTPFTDLLHQMATDLVWLSDLGDAVLSNEEQVLITVQTLREKAYEQGNLTSNDYIQVDNSSSQITIEPVTERVVYVPYYDTRVVYGDWWWHDTTPIYWSHPSHYAYYHGVYWSPRIYLSSRFYFGGFHWSSRRVVVNYDYYRHPPRYIAPHRVRVQHYTPWRHDVKHRHHVRYTRAPQRTMTTQRYSTPHRSQPPRQAVDYQRKLKSPKTPGHSPYQRAKTAQHGATTPKTQAHSPARTQQVRQANQRSQAQPAPTRTKPAHQSALAQRNTDGPKYSAHTRSPGTPKYSADSRTSSASKHSAHARSTNPIKGDRTQQPYQPRYQKPSAQVVTPRQSQYKATAPRTSAPRTSSKPHRSHTSSARSKPHAPRTKDRH